jgi:nanoRNase/pAp phosphatase (c-di-AMP/oligoRNAs hydrolase)
MKFIITSGYQYIDIDVLASSFALNELMHLDGKKSAVHLTGPFNVTIPARFNYWDVKEINRHAPLKDKEHRFILVDISNPHHVEPFVEIDKVRAVYDHHFGYEEFWHSRLGKEAKIEQIGACATFIWEEFKSKKLCHKISPSSANLLYTAVISNTLNFNAQISSTRDEQAAKEILSFTTLPKEWIKTYYSEIENLLLQDLQEFIKKDTKYVNFFNLKYYFSQIEVWNAKNLISQYNFWNVMSSIFPEHLWILNLISIDENCSYLFTNSGIIKNSLKNIFSMRRKKHYLKTEHLWLRKEILKYLAVSIK